MDTSLMAETLWSSDLSKEMAPGLPWLQAPAAKATAGSPKAAQDVSEEA